MRPQVNTRGGDQNSHGGWGLDLLLAGAFMVLHLAFASTLLRAAGDLAFRLVLGSLAILVLVGIGLACLRGRWGAAAAAASIFLLLGCQAVVFSALAHEPINWNIVFSYVPAASFIVFCGLSARDLEKALQFLFLISLAYCLGYSVLATSLVDLPGPKTLEDDVRGTRLFFSAAHGAYCLFYGLAHMKRVGASWRWLLVVMIAATAIGSSVSRGLILVVATTVLMTLFVGTGRAVRRLVVAVFLFAAAALLSGILIPEFNPFTLFGGDPSAAARARAYATLQTLLESQWIVGLGLASDLGAYAAFLGERHVYWEDLGAFGVWSTFGLLGLVLFIGLAVFCILGARRPAGVSPAPFAALSWTGIAMGLTALYSPDIFGGTSASVVGLLIASALLHPHRSSLYGANPVAQAPMILGEPPIPPVVMTKLSLH